MAVANFTPSAVVIDMASRRALSANQSAAPKPTSLPSLSARILANGEVTYDIENALPQHARSLMLAALSMCIDLALIRDGIEPHIGMAE
jgi:hypothetical protein